MDRYVRTIEDVNTVVGHAKLDLKELSPVTQVFYFGEQFADYKLLELNDELLQVLTSGQRLVFKGEATDKAVLCTKTATYDVKAAETSNSLLLVPDLDLSPSQETCEERQLEERKVVGIYKEYFEVKKTKPRLKRLKTLLSLRQYEGPDIDNVDDNMFTKEELFERIQASEEELEAALIELDALEIYGKWRILSPDYLFKSLSLLLNLLEEKSWSFDSIPLGPVLDYLKELLPRPVLEHIIQAFLEPTGDSDEDEELFTLKVDKTCRFIGEHLLRPVGRFNLDDFLQAWEQSVPEGMQTDLKQLEGIALLLKDSRPSSLKYFPEDSLPEEIIERFECLFEEKKLWTFDEIKPYLSKLSSEKQSVQALLTRCARASHIDGVKYYSARHGK